MDRASEPPASDAVPLCDEQAARARSEAVTEYEISERKNMTARGYRARRAESRLPGARSHQGWQEPSGALESTQIRPAAHSHQTGPFPPQGPPWLETHTVPPPELELLPPPDPDVLPPFGSPPLELDELGPPELELPAPPEPDVLPPFGSLPLELDELCPPEPVLPGPPELNALLLLGPGALLPPEVEGAP
jgi:hypothetical protein